MTEKSGGHTQPDKRLAAVCGLFCPSCTVYIGTHEHPERLKRIAAQFGVPVEEAMCDGCRAERRCPYCATCKMEKCAAEKGLDFCGQCEDYPCEELEAFQRAMPHRIELWETLERISQVGWEAWYQEMLAHFACPECGTLNSAYDRSCRNCGSSPSCAYVGRHQDRIARMVHDQK
ncbi:MAG: DUF3795 domain-containing protein [Proteobacteria bacterium]|nr:DUF3795 domain-containing protein [Pseudomonadota bacterium]